MAFWSATFSTLRPAKKARVVSVGSKSSLEEYAKRIVSGVLKNVVVAMDSDYWTINGYPYAHTNVICTRGYSWENDVLQGEVLKKVFFTFCPTCRASYDPLPELQALFMKNSQTVKRLAYTDYVFTAKGIKLIDRNKADSLIRYGGKQEPTINRRRLVDIVRKGRVGIQRGVTGKIYRNIDPYRIVVGKVLAALAYRWNAWLAQKQSASIKISKDAFLSSCITMFADWLLLSNSSQLSKHYRHLINNVV